MNRADFQNLAEERLGDAQVLLAQNRFGGAYYLAGYVVECALKACIAKLMRAEDFPEKGFEKQVYTHKLENLKEAADLTDKIKQSADADPEFQVNWALVIGWSEDSRYEPHSEEEAAAILAAVSDSDHGVLPCLRQYW